MICNKKIIKQEDRKDYFIIKQIFSDWLNKFLETYPSFKILNVIFKNVRNVKN